jgi:uncharacterized membrane protein YeaQ/YmgE (transglycosylase-associated protein family)
MDIGSIIIWLLVGLIAGWLAAKIVRGTGLGLIGDLVVGIIGAFIGGWLATTLGIGAIVKQPFIDHIIVAAIGAVLLLVALRLIKR